MKKKEGCIDMCETEKVKKLSPIWIDIIRKALAEYGCNEEACVLLAWEKINGEMTLIEFDDLIKEISTK